MMRLLRLLLIAALIIQTPFSRVAQAAFEDRGVGGRAPGMGEAQVAVADDANAVYYNPAGLIQIGTSQISSEYGQFVKGLDDGSSLAQTYLSYAQPWKRGYTAVGLAYQNFEAANLFKERTIMAGIARRINTEPFGWRGIWSIGANLKQFYRQYEPDRFTENALNDAGTASGRGDPLFGSGYSNTAYAMDLGALYQFGTAYNYSAGLVVTNVNQPDVSLAGDDDKAPMISKLGLAYRPVWGVMSVEFRRAKRLASDNDTDVGLGFERNLRLSTLGALTFRGGYQEGSRGFKSVSAGLSYHFAKMILDYAFNFPIGSLADSNGTHRMGVSFKLGATANEKLIRDYTGVSLLKAFTYDSLTQHIMMSQAALARNYTSIQRELLLRLLIRKYPLDDPGFDQIRPEISNLLKNRADVMDWPQLVYYLTSSLSAEDRPEATKALNALVKGDANTALSRLALLSSSGRKDPLMMGVSLMNLGELAAKSYRASSLDRTIDYVRQMLEILPDDPIIKKAYQDLLSERSGITESFNKQETPEVQLPEAPSELVAPRPVDGEKNAVSEQEQVAKSYGTALGYYLTRKAAGASLDERMVLLKQMKAVYGTAGVDMSLIDREMAETEALGGKTIPAVKPVPVEKAAPAAQPAAPKVAPKPTAPAPVKKAAPAPAPAPKSTVKPTETKSDPALEREWEYYKQASDRDITDHERMEILKGMLQKYGERGAAKINKELERIRKRMAQ